MLTATGYGVGFELFTDETLTTQGLAGTYIDRSLQDVDEPDWRVSQTIAGTRVDGALFFPGNSLGTRADVGLTGGTDENWDEFSVQWDGVVRIDDPGTRIATRSADGSRMWIDINQNGSFEPSELRDNMWGTRTANRTGPSSSPLPDGVFAIRVQYYDAQRNNAISLIANPVIEASPFELFADSALTNLGLTGSYVDQSLGSIDEPDWRVSQLVSGTRVDREIDFLRSWGARDTVGLTGGNDLSWAEFSVQWDGYVDIRRDGVRLETRSNDSSRMWVDVDQNGAFDNEELFDNQWGTTDLTTNGVPSNSLDKGVYAIRMQFENGPCCAQMELRALPFEVRIGYVIPSNRTPQPDGVRNLQELLPKLQLWFAEQMDRWGFGPKTFPYETEADGITPRVYVIHAGFDDATIREDVWTLTAAAANGGGAPVWNRSQMWLLIPEIHSQNPDGSIDGRVALGGGSGSGSDAGVAIIGSDHLFRLTTDRLLDDTPYDGKIVPEIGPYPLVHPVSFEGHNGTTISSIASEAHGVAAHELGHAFGLNHDFRNESSVTGNVMGLGLHEFRGALYPDRFSVEDTRLSWASALGLNSSQYFNTFPLHDEQRPTLQLNVSSTPDPVNGLLEIEFTATDDVELSSALLKRNGNVIGEMPLNGTSVTTNFPTAWYEAGQSEEYEVTVYDTTGNRQDASVTVVPTAPANRAPQPQVDVFHSHVRRGGDVTFDAGLSVDPDGFESLMTVEWDLDGDGTFDTLPTTSKVFTTQFPVGAHVVFARLTDSEGATSISPPIAVRVVDAFVSTGTLFARTADLNDIVEISQAFGNPALRINGVHREFPSDLISAVDVATGSGNDIVRIPDADFSTRRLDGGNGIDTVQFVEGGLSIDLSAADEALNSFEVIDITGTAANSLSLTFEDVLAVTDTANTLTVRRDVDDTVEIGTGWTEQSDETIGGTAYEVFVQGGATLKVEIVVSLDIDGDHAHGINDAILPFRFLIGSTNVTTGLEISQDALRPTHARIVEHLSRAETSMLDSDGDGDTDGVDQVVSFRFLTNRANLAAGVTFSDEAKRTTHTQLQNFLSQFYPTVLPQAASTPRSTSGVSKDLVPDSAEPTTFDSQTTPVINGPLPTLLSTGDTDSMQGGDETAETTPTGEQSSPPIRRLRQMEHEANQSSNLSLVDAGLASGHSSFRNVETETRKASDLTTLDNVFQLSPLRVDWPMV